MKKVKLTIQEIWDASKQKIFRNKKKYTRKKKHKYENNRDN